MSASPVFLMCRVPNDAEKKTAFLMTDVLKSMERSLFFLADKEGNARNIFNYLQCL
jgi:hypothetical protein